MNLEFTAEELQQLSEIAAHEGTDPERLVKDVSRIESRLTRLR